MEERKSILIVVDDLYVGGIQRIALDHLYNLSDQGLDCLLVCLSPVDYRRSSMVEVDENFFLPYSARVLYTSKKWLNQLRSIFKLHNRHRFSLILCHSPRANLLTRILKVFTFSRFKIVAFIHQVPSFSSKKQNFKRGMYFRFADFVWAGSNQFRLEINRLRSESLFYRFIFRNDVVFERPGIYLRRINFMQDSSKISRIDKRALVFYGRAVAWKGFEVFLSLTGNLEKRDTSYVLTSKEYSSVFVPDRSEFAARIEVIVAKSIASVQWPNLAIHVYPTDYGNSTKFPMSISLNVLECVALGIPSIISYEAYESWPEFQNSILCKMTTWEKSETFEIIAELQNAPTSIFLEEAKKLRNVISIEHQCNRIIGLVNS